MIRNILQLNEEIARVSFSKWGLFNRNLDCLSILCEYKTRLKFIHVISIKFFTTVNPKHSRLLVLSRSLLRCTHLHKHVIGLFQRSDILCTWLWVLFRYFPQQCTKSCIGLWVIKPIQFCFLYQKNMCDVHCKNIVCLSKRFSLHKDFLRFIIHAWFASIGRVVQ